MKKTVTKRVVGYFFIVILFIVIVINFAILFDVKNYYYNNIQNSLNLRLENTISFYERYYKDKSFNEILYMDSAPMLGYEDVQAQLIDKDGNIVYDNMGGVTGLQVPLQNLENPNAGYEILKDLKLYGKERVMSVTGKLINSKGNVIGYVRFISSLTDANQHIRGVLYSMLIFSGVIILLSLIFSFLFARSITKPITELTKTAKKFASGDYTDRLNIKSYEEIEQLSKTMNIMADEILKKEQIKNDFISSISHELRTPLTSIKGWAAVLKGLKPEEKQYLEEGLTIIENESDRLGEMVENLLDFSRFVSGRISLEKSTVDITDVVRDVVKQLTPKMNNNQITFIDEINEEAELMSVDENRIRQLIINILDNAIKFTSTGGWVKVQTFKDKDKFRILVSDNGRGISKDELKRVKEKFYKGKHSKSHSGIGLSISDEIAKLHGGSLNIYSERNMGTTVSIELPIESEEV